jgi:hypothetical protein
VPLRILPKGKDISCPVVPPVGDRAAAVAMPHVMFFDQSIAAQYLCKYATRFVYIELSRYIRAE